MANKLPKHRADWTDADVAKLRKMAPTRPARRIADQLGRTVAAVRRKAGLLDVSFRRSPNGKAPRKSR